MFVLLALLLDRVRGWNGLSGSIVVEEYTADATEEEEQEEPVPPPSVCRMVYVIKSDLKGWLSVRLVELAITTVISKFYEAVRAEVACQRYASPYSISLSLPPPSHSRKNSGMDLFGEFQ